MRPRKKPNLAPRLAACAPVVIQSPEEKKGRIREEFPNPGAPLYLELGCGQGRVYLRACLPASRNQLRRDGEGGQTSPSSPPSALWRPGCPTCASFSATPTICRKSSCPARSGASISTSVIPGTSTGSLSAASPTGGRLAVYNALLADGGRGVVQDGQLYALPLSTFEFDACMERYFSTTDLHRSEYAEGNIMTEYERYFSNPRPADLFHPSAEESRLCSGPGSFFRGAQTRR